MNCGSQFLWLALLISCGACATAPVQEAPSLERMMPLAQSAQWVYRATEVEPVQRLLFHCQDSGLSQDTTTGRARRVYWEAEWLDWQCGVIAWSLREDGLWRIPERETQAHAHRIMKHTQAEKVLPRGPWRVGQRWVAKPGTFGEVLALDEMVQVTLGQFSSLHVRLTGPKEQREDFWFVPDVGIVKHRGFQALTLKVQLDLAEYWPGDDDINASLPQVGPVYRGPEELRAAFQARRELWLKNRREQCEWRLAETKRFRENHWYLIQTNGGCSSIPQTPYLDFLYSQWRALQKQHQRFGQ